jgi:hypothetical protein
VVPPARKLTDVQQARAQVYGGLKESPDTVPVALNDRDVKWQDQGERRARVLLDSRS